MLGRDGAKLYTTHYPWNRIERERSYFLMMVPASVPILKMLSCDYYQRFIIVL